MRGLTLRMPWDYAHVYLDKRVENRTWRIAKDRYALHTGKGIDHDGTSYIESLGERIEWTKIVPSAIFAVCDIIRLVEIDHEKPVTGLHQALLFDTIEADDRRRQRDHVTELLEDFAEVQPGQPMGLLSIPPAQRRWAFGPWAHLYDPKTFRILPKPVPCSGAQGLWELPAEVWRDVFDQLLKMQPVVLNRHIHGKPQGSVYVGRPSKWGNPFTWNGALTRVNPHLLQVVPKEKVLDSFRDWVFDRAQRQLREDAKRELRGRDLVCSCAPNPCHADTWLEVANAA